MVDVVGGNAEQVRVIAEQVAAASASAAIREFNAAHPNYGAPQKVEIPPALKLAGSIVAALMTAGVIAMTVWGVSTLNELQITVAQIDVRQQQDTTSARLDKIEERLSRLESRK